MNPDTPSADELTSSSSSVSAALVSQVSAVYTGERVETEVTPGTVSVATLIHHQISFIKSSRVTVLDLLSVIKVSSSDDGKSKVS